MSERGKGTDSEREREPSRGGCKMNGCGKSLKGLERVALHQRQNFELVLALELGVTRLLLPAASAKNASTARRRNKNKGTAPHGTRHSKKQQPSPHRDTNGSVMMFSNYEHANKNIGHNTTMKLDQSARTIAPRTTNSTTGSTEVEPQIHIQNQNQMSHRY